MLHRLWVNLGVFQVALLRLTGISVGSGQANEKEISPHIILLEAGDGLRYAEKQAGFQ